MKPLPSLKEVDDFLVIMDRKFCPWCDGKSWGIHVVPEKEALGLRALPRMGLSQADDGSIEGQVTISPAEVLTVVVAECKECGYVYLFNYFSLVSHLNKRRAENRAAEAVKTSTEGNGLDGIDSSN